MIFKEHKSNYSANSIYYPRWSYFPACNKYKSRYCAKVLQGERLFNLLLYAILKTDRISQRFLEDILNLLFSSFCLTIL